MIPTEVYELAVALAAFERDEDEPTDDDIVKAFWLISRLNQRAIVLIKGA